MRQFFVFPGLFILSAILLITQPLFSQVNTEKFRKYDVEKGFQANLQTTFTTKAGNTHYNTLKATSRLDYSATKFDYFLVANFEAKSASKKRIENEGFIHLRGMWKFADKANWEYFAQRQYDEFIDLRFRNLLGTAIKYRILKAVSKNDSNSMILINASTGLMYEHENYKYEPTNIDNKLIRSTNFISFDWSKNESTSFTGVIYYQPAFNDRKNFRIVAESTLEFNIIKRVFFSINFVYKYNNHPFTDVKPYDISLENGLRLKL
ncbi:MAG: DUF481 domain-containing protein [Bacteroidales bacterium]|nr:DUF481 domain-containing protein [Bacteroidales bacterium]OQC37751.1 MAG: hypothetical protein BWX63_00832 [Bacteroidetes bacterium ADurb.Bin041]HNV50813.1 DUF481 domain-containing protein [Bacteroidales bacterium]HNY59496.1 DUF481 domain-containing protein [Bacteroidales bacterium]HOF80906.1 DUF481 domain-containing protein [Bacteroidales bacterium]